MHSHLLALQRTGTVLRCGDCPVSEDDQSWHKYVRALIDGAAINVGLLLPVSVAINVWASIAGATYIDCCTSNRSPHINCRCSNKCGGFDCRYSNQYGALIADAANNVML